MSNTAPTGPPGIYALDTSILNLSLRGDGPIRARLATTTKLYIPVAALGELYAGAFGSPTRATAALSDVSTLATTMSILNQDATTSLTYGRLKHDLKTRGFAMPDNDLWIAATAIQYDLTLAARDAHFNWVTGLRVEQW